MPTIYSACHLSWFFDCVGVATVSILLFGNLRLFNRLFSDKEFTDEKMQKAVVLDYTFSSFLNLCKTYCGHDSALTPLELNEDEAFARLDQARQSVHAALCDDFNTPKVIEELNELVGYMNRLFQSNKTPASATAESVSNRHHGPVMAFSNFLQDTLDTFGVTWRADANSASSSAKIEQILEASIKFRRQVRNLALDKSTPKDAKTRMLALCDDLRIDFQKASVELKDTKDNTIWQIRSDQK